MANLDRVGIFRAQVADYALRDFDSGALAITIKFRVLAQYDGQAEEWVDWSEYEETYVHGDVFIVKKDGTPNDAAIRNLANVLNWDGNVVGVVEKKWLPPPCQITVEPNVYKERTSYRVKWISRFDDDPNASASLNSISPDKAREISNKYGAFFRAIASENANNSKKPSAPATAPPAKMTKTPAGGEIPF